MNTNIKKAGTLAFATLSLLSVNASATPIEDIDNFTIWDGYRDSYNSPAQGENQHTFYGGDYYRNIDVVGRISSYDVSKATINKNNNGLTIDLHTNFIQLGLGSMPDYTQTNYSQGRGISTGDLFLTSNWNPFGSASNHYLGDNLNTTGTDWNYVVSLGDERWDTSGVATIYQILNEDSYLTSDNFMSDGQFRNNQLFAVDPTLGGLLDTGLTATWNGTQDGILRFMLDIDSLNGFDNQLGMHWTMACGNDVVEGATAAIPSEVTTVPEPTSLMLLGLGLIGVAGLTKKRQRNKT